MPTPTRRARQKMEIPFDDVCARLETALTGGFRRDIVADAMKGATTLGGTLLRLREGLRSDVWKPAGVRVDLARAVRTYDSRTRQEGFHALHDWDGVADSVNEETIPIDVLHYIADKAGLEAPDPAVLAILLDYYFMHLLSLLSLRLWDEGDADANLERLEELLGHLQGPEGSGQQFCNDAETLILISTAHYEREEWGYDLLLERTRTLNAEHRARIAIGHAAAMGCHLRFGFEATYGRDIVNMRDDNVADYPWLCFSVATLMAEYARMSAEGVTGEVRETLVEALLNGLSPDPGAFLAAAPSSLSAHEEERLGFRALYYAHEDALLAEFEAHRPTVEAYSPLSFFFNFSHNVLKGTVVDALIWGQPWRVSLNDLFCGVPRGGERSAAKEKLARTLMGYARANPHRIRGRLMPVIVYDPAVGHRAFSLTMRKLREAGGRQVS
ncbi:MAG: hypothetical protein Q8L86_19355 [Vicinamibacterales bacterium]|nr:hypothetical protein [Vicinamibacterales bacterium]